MSDDSKDDRSKDWSAWLEGAFSTISDMTGEKAAPLTPEQTAIRNFFRSIDAGKLTEVEQQLADNPSLIHTTYKGVTPLHHAARFNMVSIMECLVRRGADPLIEQHDEYDDPTGIKPIHTALRYERMEAVAWLAKHGGYDYTPDENGWSLLHHVCAEGQVKPLQALLAAGVDPNLLTASGSSPLMIAILKEQNRIASILLDIESVQEAINVHYATTDIAARTAFHFALENPDMTQLRRMIAAGAFVNAPNGRGETPLMLAIDTEYAPLVHLLAKNGADIANTAETAPLLYFFNKAAFDVAGEEMLQTLQKDGADISAINPATLENAFHILAARIDGHIYIPLVHGPDINSQTINGISALRIAIDAGHVETAKSLLRKGADPTRPDADGKTASMIAAEKGLSELAEALKNAEKKKKPQPKAGPGTTSP